MTFLAEWGDRSQIATIVRLAIRGRNRQLALRTTACRTGARRRGWTRCRCPFLPLLTRLAGRSSTHAQHTYTRSSARARTPSVYLSGASSATHCAPAWPSSAGACWRSESPSGLVRPLYPAPILATPTSPDLHPSRLPACPVMLCTRRLPGQASPHIGGCLCRAAPGARAVAGIVPMTPHLAIRFNNTTSRAA